MELSGKTAIVTGSNTGLGFETALDLYQRGAKVFVACRDKEKGLDAIKRMKATSDGGELIYGHLDLASLSSVKEFADKVMPVLRERGLAQTEYSEGTLRKKLFGHDRLPETHPAAQYRGAFAQKPLTV